MHFLQTLFSVFVPVAYAAGESGEESAHSNSLTGTISSIEKTSGLLEKYGVEIVILSVFIVVFLIILMVIVNNNRKLMNKLLERESLSGVDPQEIIKKTVDACAQKMKEAESKAMKDAVEEGIKKEKESHKKAIEININTYQLFKDASKDVIDRLHCQRVAIYLLHNGNETPYGYPFAKLTCTHEYTSRGTCSTPRGVNHNSIPLYAFSNMIGTLLEDGEYRIDDVANENNYRSEEEKNQFLDFISGTVTHKIQSAFALGIKDSSGIVAAFTIVEFHSPQTFDFYYLDDLRETLGDMNKIIKPIVTNPDFVNSYQHGPINKEEKE